MECTIQNHGQCAAPILTADVGQRCFFANGGIVHQHIQASKPISHLVHHGFHRLGIGHVGHTQERWNAHGGQLIDHGLAFGY
jgi:hypothetical protein